MFYPSYARICVNGNWNYLEIHRLDSDLTYGKIFLPGTYNNRNKKEQTIDSRDMDECQMHFAKWKKPDPKST